jgi:bacterial/archaeal transporter family-2 protein
MEAVAIPFLLLVGALLAVQAGANVQLSAALAHPAGASALQLCVGAALLIALAAVLGGLGALATLDDVAAWHLVGGLGSAVYITAGILLFPRLGALVAVGLFIAGQMGASLLLDGSGWLGVERESLGLSAIAGGLAVVAGTWMIVRAQAGADSLDAALRNRGGWLAVGLAAGAVLPVQGAVNAQLRADVDAPITVGAFSFLVATATMAVVLAAVLAIGHSGRPTATRLRGVPWWGWLGGACGATYVTSVFVLIPEIGVAPTVALTVAGQQIASVFVDRYGLLRLPRRSISRARLTGVVVLLAGVGLIQLA